MAAGQQDGLTPQKEDRMEDKLLIVIERFVTLRGITMLGRPLQVDRGTAVVDYALSSGQVWTATFTLVAGKWGFSHSTKRGVTI
jgi:hypothetical protein